MKRLAIAAMAASAISVCAMSANATTYTGVRTFGGATVDLSITTDGTIGSLSQGNITNWNISVVDSAGSVDMTPADSQFEEYLSDLNATSTGLYYNFSNDGGVAIWEETSIGDGGPFYCLNAGGSNCWGTTSPAEGASTQWGENPIESVGQSGNVLIAGSVPEPATWTMLILGVAMVGFAARRRREGTAFAA